MAARWSLKRLLLTLGALIFALSTIIHFSPALTTKQYSYSQLWPSLASNENGASSAVDLSDYSAVITNEPRWHEDIWIWLGSTLRSMEVQTVVATECDDENDGGTCVRFGMLDSAIKAGVWSGPRRKKKELKQSIEERNPAGQLPSVIFLTTEKNDIENYNDMLWELWEARADHEKFKIVPIYHHWSNNLGSMAKWAENGALEYLTIASHVQKTLLGRLDELSMGDGNERSGYEHIPVHVVHPVIDVLDQVRLPPESEEIHHSQHKTPCRVMMVGMLNPERRDYDKLFNDLESALKREAAVWGYHWDEPSGLWQPNDPSDPDNFKLFLVGERHDRFPIDAGKLSNVITIIPGETQSDFYEIMAYSDIILTGWRAGSSYYHEQAGGGTYRSLEVNVPVLVTETILKRYDFLKGNVSITRPQGVSDIEAIGYFRKYHNAGMSRMTLAHIGALISHDLPAGSPDFLRMELAEMLRKGWQLPTAAFRERREELWDHNRQILADVMMRSSKFRFQD